MFCSRNVLLYAEDNHSQLLLKRALFEHWEYSVLKASSGEQACDLFGQQKFDVVVLDYNCPVVWMAASPHAQFVAAIRECRSAYSPPKSKYLPIPSVASRD